jgi:hypothetical protein
MTRTYRLSVAVISFVFAVTAGDAGAAGSRSAGRVTTGIAPGLPPLAEQQRYRAELGLPASTEVVKDLNAAWSAGELPGGQAEGAVFTAREEQELDVREDAGHEIAAAARAYFRGDLRSAFGGVYIDHDSGDTVVLVTRDAARHLAALRSRVTHADRLRTAPVRYALADLDRVAAELTARLGSLHAAAADVTSLGANERTNVVDVNLGADTPAARSAVLAALRPADRAMVRFWEAPAMRPTGVDALNAPPLKGGQRITQPATQVGLVNICTSGFIAYERVRTDALIYVTNYFMVTSGHCNRNSNPWSQYQTYPIGTPDRNRYVNNGIDAMRIPINAADSSQKVAITTTNDRLIYYRQASSADVLNERVCMSGATTGGEVCGVLLSRGITVTSEGRTLTNVRVASYTPNQGGDSGGSVLHNSEAKGLNSGTVVFNGATRSAYAHISLALSQLALTNVVGVG